MAAQLGVDLRLALQLVRLNAIVRLFAAGGLTAGSGRSTVAAAAAVLDSVEIVRVLGSDAIGVGDAPTADVHL
jgi:hypothetical protein